MYRNNNNLSRIFSRGLAEFFRLWWQRGEREAVKWSSEAIPRRHALMFTVAIPRRFEFMFIVTV